jgi:tryptophanyl-tRNA synthetase
MTQFKSKAGSERESASTALFDYPVLMAADILLYHTKFVPVGEDQKQHVELTRDIAERFNSMYGETFTVPEPLIPEIGARIMSLDDPSRKMSKSEPNGAVFLLDPPDLIRRKIGRAVTDSLGVVRYRPEQEGLYNLLTMIQTLTGEAEDEIELRFQGRGYKAVKDELGNLVIEALEPIQQRYADYAANPDLVDDILRQGAERAQPMASSVVTIAQDRLGLRKSHGKVAVTRPAV